MEEALRATSADTLKRITESLAKEIHDKKRHKHDVVDVNVARSCIQEKEKRKSFSALSLFLSLFISVENEKVKVPSI